MRWLFIVLSVLAVALPARAQTSAIVGPFGAGRDGAQARRAVTGALEGVVAVASRDAVTQAARDAHESPTSEAGLLAAARVLRVELVVTGMVIGRGGRARTTIIVTSAEGRELARTVVGPPFGRIGATAVGNAAITVVQEAQNELARQRQMTDSHQAWPTPAPLPPPPPDPSIRPTGAPPWVRVLAGVDIRTHDAWVFLTGGGTRAYSAGAYPELGASLEIHPLNGLGSAGAGLYVRGDGGVSVGLKSEDPSDPGVAVATTTWRLGGALGYLGLVADGIVGLGGSLGIGVDRFSIADNTIYPSTMFTFFRAGLDARFALVRDLFVLGVGGGYRVVLGTGGLDDPCDPGAPPSCIDTAFGVSASSGYDVRVELSGALPIGFTWALRFAYERFDHTFSPPGYLGSGDSGSDETLRFGAFGGWSFW